MANGYGVGIFALQPRLGSGPHLGAFYSKLLNPSVIGGWRKLPEKMMHNGFVLPEDGMQSRERKRLTGFSFHVPVT